MATVCAPDRTKFEETPYHFVWGTEGASAARNRAAFEETEEKMNLYENKIYSNLRPKLAFCCKNLPKDLFLKNRMNKKSENGTENIDRPR